MEIGTIFIIAIIATIAVLGIIYDSKNETLKRFTTIILVGFFIIGIGKGTGVSFLIFFVVTGYILYTYKNIDKEKSTNNSIESFTQKNLENPEEAYKDFCNLAAEYGDYIQLSPLSYGEIRNSNVLPFSKNTLILYAIQYINISEKNIQEALLYSIPELAYYKDDIPENGYKSNTSKLIENYELTDSHNFDEDKAKEILEKVNEPNDFPNDLYNECEEYSKKLYTVLKEAIDKD